MTDIVTINNLPEAQTPLSDGDLTIVYQSGQMKKVAREQFVINDEIDATVAAVAAIAADITTVAGIDTEVTTVAGIEAEIVAVDAISTDIETVAGIDAAISTVSDNDTNITTVAGNTSNISTVAGISSDVTTVAGIAANVTTVAGISANVTTVAGISSEVTTLAGLDTEIIALDSIEGDITAVAGITADVTAVAANAADISLAADYVAGETEINALRSGAGVPSSGLGYDGDFYINTSATTIYGPKTSGSWGSPTSLVGSITQSITNGNTTESPSSDAVFDALANKVSSDPTGVTGADQIVNMMSLTQAEYNAITPDSATFYVITDA
jgi:hypothetical protein